MPRLADVLAVLDALYAPGWAEPWDAVGLVCGDPDAVVTRVLPIGGLKDKILAAHRSDIFTVIIPKENKKDLKDIPKRVLKVMKIHAVDHMDEVLRVALAHAEPDKFLPGPSEAVDWRTEPRARREAPREGDGSAEGTTAPSPTQPTTPAPATVMEPDLKVLTPSAPSDMNSRPR